MRSGSGDHDFNRGPGGRRVGGAHAGAENLHPRGVFQEINGCRVGGDEPAQARQRFAERAHDELHLVGQAEMAGRAGPIPANHTDGVGVVAVNGRAVGVEEHVAALSVGIVDQQVEQGDWFNFALSSSLKLK